MIYLKIDEIQAMYSENSVVATQHFLQRIEKRGIALSEIQAAIETGEIIEEYPSDYPHPSALILGYAHNGALHIVVGVGGGYAWLVTAYRPDQNKWEQDNRTRKVM